MKKRFSFCLFFLVGLSAFASGTGDPVVDDLNDLLTIVEVVTQIGFAIVVFVFLRKAVKLMAD